MISNQDNTDTKNEAGEDNKDCKHSQPSKENNAQPMDTTLYQNLVYQTPLRTHVKSAVYHYLKELDGQQPTNLYATFLQEVEKPLLEVVLEQTHGNQSKACLILGINRGTLRKKMQLYGLL